jgi:antitoxin (DNA-binding transcriptional repressor) of toxin-antitoxin stability system
MRATIVDLRYHMKDVLGALDRGETVTVLHRGKEKAKLIPISSAPNESQASATVMEQPLFGLWSGREELADPYSYLRNLREKRPFPKRTTKRSSPRKKQK